MKRGLLASSQQLGTATLRSYGAMVDKVAQAPGVFDGLCLMALCAGVALMVATMIWAAMYFVQSDPLGGAEVPAKERKARARRLLAAIQAEEDYKAPDPVDPEAVDRDTKEIEYEAKLLFAKAATQLMPLVERADGARGRASGRIMSLSDHAKQHLKKELLDAAEETLEALDLKQGRKLLHESVSGVADSIRLPSPAVVTAGVLAPFQLQIFRLWNWINFLLFAAICGLLLWAAITDTMDFPRCDVPGLYAWVWLSAAVCLILVVVRGVLLVEVEVNAAKYASIRDAATEVVAQAKEQRDRGEISEGEYARQIAVQYLSLSGKGLMLWDEISWSSTSSALLVGIALFLVLGLAGLGLTAWYLVMPGRVALNPGDPSTTGLFCGAGHVVLAARIMAVVYLLFFMLFFANFLAASWSVCLRRRATAEGTVKLAQSLDQRTGVPLIGPLMHAFLVRSTVDRASLRAADLEIQTSLLAAEQQQVEAEKVALQADLEAKDQAVAALREQLEAAQDVGSAAQLERAQGDLEAKSKDMMDTVGKIAEPATKAQKFTDERVDDISEVATGLKSVMDVKFVADLLASSKKKGR